MAKIIKGILGEVSGLVGTVVGAVVRGVATIRSRPKKSSKAPVQSQINQRSKFGLAGSFMQPISEIVNLGFQSYTKKMSASNAAIQEMLKNAITGVAPNFKIDFTKVVLSKGTLYPEAALKFLPPVAGAVINFTWDPTQLGPELALKHANDRMVLVFYEELTHRFILLDRVVARSAATYDAELPSLFAGHLLQVWAFWVSPDDRSVSGSQYLGSVTPIR